jgi:hypothetical protein
MTDYTDVKCSENKEKSLPTGRQACNHFCEICVIKRAYSSLFKALYQKFFLKMHFILYKMTPIKSLLASLKGRQKVGL